MTDMPNEEREMQEIINRAMPGVNDMLKTYEQVEGQYMRAVSSAAARPQVVVGANTRR